MESGVCFPSLFARANYLQRPRANPHAEETLAEGRSACQGCTHHKGRPAHPSGSRGPTSATGEEDLVPCELRFSQGQGEPRGNVHEAQAADLLCPGTDVVVEMNQAEGPEAEVFFPSRITGHLGN